MAERLLLRISEVADAIGVSKSTAYTLAARGEIPTVRLGGLLRVSADALQKLIKQKLESAKTDGGATER